MTMCNVGNSKIAPQFRNLLQLPPRCPKSPPLKNPILKQGYPPIFLFPFKCCYFAESCHTYDTDE